MGAPLVRAGLPSEAPILSALAQRAKAHWGYPDEWLEAWRPALTIDPAYLSQQTVLVAERARVVLGFVAIRDAGTHWQLDHLWVDPVVHGKGVGRALFRASIDAAADRNPGTIRIESDPFAAGFYERCGARRIGTVAAPVLGEPRQLPVLEYSLAEDTRSGRRPPVGPRAR